MPLPRIHHNKQKIMTTENTLDKTPGNGTANDTPAQENVTPIESTTEGNGTKESYAVRPHHHFRRINYSDRQNIKVRNRLNIAFILLAVVGLCMWYTMDDRTPATIVLLVGVVLKIAEVCIRLFRK